MRLFPRLAFVSVLSLLIAACASGPDYPRVPPLPGQDLDQIQALLDQAEEAPPAQSAQLRMDAASLMISEQRLDEARQIAAELTPHKLDRNNRARYALLQAKLALGRNNVLAFTWLEHPSLLSIDNTDLRIESLQLRARALHMTGSSMAAIDDLLIALELANADLRANVEEQLWNTLLEMDLGELEQARNYHNLNYLDGWIELTEIVKKPASLANQLQSIATWSQNWPTHSGIRKLAELETIIRDSAANQPTHIALVLPQSGKLEKAGNAVRDGFMAAYYNAAQEGDQLPQLRFYDSGQSTANQLINQAISDGVEMIIGPLRKNAVNELAQQPLLPLPALTLNYSSDTQTTTDGLFQFGLAAEDEARQAARRGRQEGFERAVILTQKTARGTRVANAFAKEWAAHGGTVIDQRQFTGDNDYRQVVGSLLAIDESRGRARRLAAQIQESPEFEPRRREDIDVVFVFASPQQGRILKPTLAFQYAGNLPVLSTSSIYSGKPNNSRDKDLDGIKFTGYDWLLNNSHPLMQQIRKRWSQAEGSYAGLYALGADAFMLYSRVRQMNRIEGIELDGATGNLRMNKQQHIVRELSWYQFRDGAPHALESLPPLNQPAKEAIDGMDPETALQQGPASGGRGPELSPAPGFAPVN
ncbi:penicillin-binding protein activator [Aestuariirhabdus sp. Z084]|uniref:penicillin-binding protein activator n=1 Tax=Aestuariirhabdus haliotis TaxID=2918751 RepID=UPI00201B4241|nr:penicillin-binding protein activator [Aestuariirhabdus haliotis]MCL6415922.1 penicillin-binding protein activator [Aestuariirhabdus haliotis]MCL6419920.1 penicillin-binding protein activator [Aestuariirhabdus haliotis]